MLVSAKRFNSELHWGPATQLAKALRILQTIISIFAIQTALLTFSFAVDEDEKRNE